MMRPCPEPCRSTLCTCSTCSTTAPHLLLASTLSDYILGVGDLLYDGPDEFGEIVRHNEGRPLRLYVQRAERSRARGDHYARVGWGGDGCQAAALALRALHTLPPRRNKRSLTPQSPQKGLVSSIRSRNDAQCCRARGG